MWQRNIENNKGMISMAMDLDALVSLQPMVDKLMRRCLNKNYLCLLI